ncbi:unnamed protein product [Arctogadus glacialis]
MIRGLRGGERRRLRRVQGAAGRRMACGEGCTSIRPVVTFKPKYNDRWWRLHPVVKAPPASSLVRGRTPPPLCESFRSPEGLADQGRR